MKFTRLKQQRSDFYIVITSMLDINFLLIMFFMMTAHFQRTSHAVLDLPKERGEEQAVVDEAGLVINLTRNGEIIINGTAIEFAALREMVQEQIEKERPTENVPLKLMVRADRAARSDDLNRVVTMLREQKVGTIRVATEIPQ